MQEADAQEAQGHFPIDRIAMRWAAIFPVEREFFEEWGKERQKAEGREQAADPRTEHLKARYKEYRDELVKIIKAMEHGYVGREVHETKKSAARRGAAFSQHDENKIREDAAALYAEFRRHVPADLKREENNGFAQLEADAKCCDGQLEKQTLSCRTLAIWVILMTVVIALVVLVFCLLSWWQALLCLVVSETLLVTISAFMLRSAGMLSEKSLVELVTYAFKNQLDLIPRILVLRKPEGKR